MLLRIFKSVIVGVLFAGIFVMFAGIALFFITKTTGQPIVIPNLFAASYVESQETLFGFSFTVYNMYALPAVAIISGVIYFLFGSKKTNDVYLNEDLHA